MIDFESRKRQVKLTKSVISVPTNLQTKASETEQTIQAELSLSSNVSKLLINCKSTKR